MELLYQKIIRKNYPKVTGKQLQGSLTFSKVNYWKEEFIIRLHVFWFKFRNYSLKVINIQRPKAELNIILLWVNNFDIKQKKPWNIFFIICQQHQTKSGKIKTKHNKCRSQHKFFVGKNWTQHIQLQLLVNHFILECVN